MELLGSQYLLVRVGMHWLTYTLINKGCLPFGLPHRRAHGTVTGGPASRLAHPIWNKLLLLRSLTNALQL